MTNRTVFLTDTRDNYLYHSLDTKAIVLKEGDISSIKEGIILGDIHTEITNSNIDVYPFYTNNYPNNKNYHFDKDNTGISYYLTNYAVANSPISKTNLNYLYKLSYILNNCNNVYSNKYSLYLKLATYLQLYKFNTKIQDLNSYITNKKSTNFIVDNQANFNNKYTIKKVSKPTVIKSNTLGADIAVQSADLDMQLIAKSLAYKYGVSVVHKDTFVVVYFNNKYDNNFRTNFLGLLTDKYNYSGGFYTFFLDGLQTDALVTAMKNILN